MPTLTWPPFQRWRELAAGSPDLSRAVRSTVAFMVPLLLAMTGWLRLDASFMAIAAQNLAMVDVRGDYRFRTGLLLAMTGVFVAAAVLGTLVANDLAAAVVCMGVITVASSLWRHFSSDYGPGLAIASTFVFVFALATPAGQPAVASHALATLVGGLWGIAVQVAAWPFHPQHPLRRAVGDSWVAVAELFDALAGPEEGQPDHTTDRETELRNVLDETGAVLAAAHPRPVNRRLVALNAAGADLAMRGMALDTALEALRRERDYALLAPAVDPVLVNLSNLARSVALAVVSRQPAHYVTCEVRLRRSAALLRTLRSRLLLRAREIAAAAQLADLLGQIDASLPAIHDALRATVARADERAAFSLELLDLRALALRPLASALNFSWNFDPALIRFTLRTAILTMLGVVAYKELDLPHGYWLPFTVVVVLQPDYGSTRRRAAQRVLGTLAGSILASGVLWLHLPMAGLMLTSAVTIFIFGYWIKRDYGVAVIFITLFVVLLTEAAGPVTIGLAVERLGSTAAGGLVALLAAHLFWPVWERERLPPILAAAFRANREYLRVLGDHVFRGRGLDAGLIAAKRRTERANSAAFSSLKRLNGDPRNQREGLERAAALANGNQRVTRALNVLASHLVPGAGWPEPEVTRFAALAADALELPARALEEAAPTTAEIASALRGLETERLPMPADNTGPARWAFTQLTRTATELAALLLLLQDEARA